MNFSDAMTEPAPPEAMLPPYLERLNPEQRDAVLTIQGPLLVLAGAGTGKTGALTARIAHLLAGGFAYPSQILAVTFTNKAAREMASRIAELLKIPDSGFGTQEMGAHNTPPHQQQATSNSPSPLPWLGTFHSISAKILRRHAELLGFKPSFTILDTDDQLRLLKTLLSEHNIDDKQSPPKLFLHIIQGWKDRGLTPEKITEAEGARDVHGKALAIYRAYQTRLKTLNAMDFGDLLLHCMTLFSTHPAVGEEYARRFRYILVDEYQDTNVVQYLWLRLLAGGHGNLCCVGDDDQSIYGWRGAQVDNILRFEKDFPGAAVIRLERNYRSTRHILGAASGLIAHNRGRLGKTLWTQETGGEKIRIKPVWDDAEEARWIGDEVESLQRDKIPLMQMAVLVRAGFQTRAFEERFMTLGIPYRVVGGLRFYERLEIRDAIAYLRLVAQPDDDLAFERVVNTPKRGLGKSTLEQLHSAARARNVSLARATRELLAEGVFKGKTAASLQGFIDLVAHGAQAAVDGLTLAELADMILERSGYRAMWQQDSSPEAAGRLENLRELLRAMAEFPNLIEFLEHVGLVTALDDGTGGDMLNLMTLHSAKGLEFEAVFLPGWEEGLFPHQRSLDETGGGGLEEERRLAYVGITRARQHLTITHAANRRIYNQWQSSIPSRFLKELPDDHVQRLEGGAYGTGLPFLQARYAQARATADRENVASATVAAEQPFPPGTRIFHQKFGYGRVMSAQGTHLDIAFEKSGHKKLIADFVTKV